MATPRHEVSFDRVAHEYDETRGGLARAQGAARDLLAHLPDGDLLEIGVGTGIVAAAVLGEGLAQRPAPSSGRRHRIAGIDISEQMLARAAQRLPGAVVRASAGRLPFPDNGFDAVIAVHVLHLVPDLTATLTQAARVVRSGGRLVAIHGEPEHPAGDELIEATRALRSGLPARPDTPTAVREAAATVGLRLVAQQHSSPRAGGHSPNELADLVDRRSWSFLWDLDDQQWQSLAVPAMERLRALPDPDRHRVQLAHTWITVLEKA